ncbi:MAG: NAD(P)H-dependent oxidoreductase [Elusimicrobia bacterium]|nr:NAD(P)H-dependent oxidoreductase [Elusimicrobiota bacterium]
MMRKEPAITILGICASLESNSRTLRVLELALQAAAREGAETNLANLRDFEIGQLNSPFQTRRSPGHLRKLKGLCRKASGIIMATPEYHGSFTGALKSVLDWMGFEEFEGKMIGLIGVAGGSMGALGALSHLRAVCRQLHAWVVPEQVSISNSAETLNHEGNPRDPLLVKRLEQLGVQVARFSMLHSQHSWNEFVKLWEQGVQNPGGRKH